MQTVQLPVRYVTAVYRVVSLQGIATGRVCLSVCLTLRCFTGIWYISQIEVLVSTKCNQLQSYYTTKQTEHMSIKQAELILNAHKIEVFVDIYVRQTL